MRTRYELALGVTLAPKNNSITDWERSDRCQRTEHSVHVDIGRFAPVLLSSVAVTLLME
jgi:hypothetical protein